MTWGEIQKISLEKMFAKDEPIDVSKIDTLKQDDDCKWYLGAMPAVCNEAIQRIKPYIMSMYTYNEEKEQYEKTTIEDACVLIPLYIASQLYKDDDISQATAYRNEFEVGLQNLYYNIETQESIKEVY